jgi:hypothetical protein
MEVKSLRRQVAITTKPTTTTSTNNNNINNGQQMLTSFFFITECYLMLLIDFRPLIPNLTIESLFSKYKQYNF